MTKEATLRRTLAITALLVAASCAQPPPPPPAPPPAPTFAPVATKPQDDLSIKGVSAPAGPGKQSVAIFVNNQRVIEGTLTTASPRATFRGKYEDHDIEAKCKLVERVDCEILVDGSPESAAGGRERP